MNPYLGAALIVLSLVASFVFSRYHVDAGSAVATVLGVGVTLVQGVSHQAAVTAASAKPTSSSSNTTGAS